MKRGRFITFEGGEGAGKSTQIALLADALTKAGEHVIVTREPGGTPGAEQIRELLVKGSADRWTPIAETLLFQAARVQHAETLILPALAEGKTVLCDRFFDSTRVYQGVGKQLSSEWIDRLHAMTLGTLRPDVTLIFDLPVEVGLARAGKRQDAENRFEGMKESFHQAVRDGFLECVRREPGRCKVIDASKSVEEVHRQVLKFLL